MKIEIGSFTVPAVEIMKNKKLGLFAAGEWQRQMTPFVPFKTGTLSRTVSHKPWEVHYNVPYARKMYNGMKLNFSKQYHPLASAKWDEKAKEANGDKLVKAIENYINVKGLD